MTCSGRYAEAYQFVSYWCVGSVLNGVDDDGVGPNAFVTDSTIDFLQAGVVAGIGQTLYNVTDGSEGPITGVTVHTITAPLTGGTLNTWTVGNLYRVLCVDAAVKTMTETVLDMTAADIHGVMAAQGMCDCTLATWALGLLRKLNIIEAAAFYMCPCGKPHMTDDMRMKLMDWSTNELTNIRKGLVELCSGETGVEFPAITWADQSWTEFNAAEIIVKDILD